MEEDQRIRNAINKLEHLRISHRYYIDLSNNKDELKFMVAYGFFGIPEDGNNSADSYSESNSFILLYSKEKQEIINLVIEAILNNCFTTHIYLAITYLFCKPDDDNSSSNSTRVDDTNVPNLVPVCIFGFSSSQNNFKFIDSEARIYTNWNDFLENNKLPPCTYFYPKYGIYTNSSSILKIKSPSSAVLSMVLKQADLASVVTCFAAGFSYFLVANPVGLSLLAGTATVSAFYNSGRSMYELYDRGSHQQTIGLSDPSSRNAWFNITSTILTAGVVGATARVASLTQRFGVTATKGGLMLLNGMAIIVDTLGFCNFIHNMYSKWMDNELEFIDVGLFCLQLFFLSGTLLNATQLFNNLSNINDINANMNKTLTKTQKRNLRKRMAKARARGAVVNIVKVDKLNNNIENSSTIFNIFMNLPSTFGLQLLFCLFPRGEIIFRHITSIRNDYESIMNKKLNLDQFMLRTIKHLENLIRLLKQDFSVLKSKLLSFVNFFRTEQEENDISTSLDNGVTKISSMISDELEDSTGKSVHETTGTENSLTVTDDIVIRSLCEFLKQFSGKIYDLCLISSNNIRLVNNEELVKVYRMTMISVINHIMSRLPSLANDEQFSNNEQLFGISFALVIKSYEDRKIFDEIVSSLPVQDLFLSNAKHIFFSRKRDCRPSDEIEYFKIHDLAYYLNSMLQMIRKEDGSLFSYQYELILLKRLLLNTPSNETFLVDNLTDHCERKLSTALNVLRLENDHFQSYCIRSPSEERNNNSREANSSMRPAVKDGLMKYKKIFEISCFCLCKLQNAGFNAGDVSIAKLITILIDFISTKLVNEFRNNQTSYLIQGDSQEIFIQLIDTLANQIVADDFLLAECIEFCLNRLDKVNHVQIWKEVLNDEDVEFFSLYDVNNVVTLYDRLEAELSIDLKQFNLVPNNNNDNNDNYYVFTVKNSSRGSNIEMIIAYTEPQSSSEYYVIIYKKREIQEHEQSNNEGT